MQSWKTLFVVAAIIVMVAACSQKEPTEPLTEAPYFTTLAEAQAAASDDDKYIVLKFYTDWCKWCTTLDTVVLVDSTAIQFFVDEMVLVKINAEEDTATANKYHVRGYPTLVMVDKHGEEVDRLVGYLDTEEFLQTFRDYSKGIGTLEDLVNRADTAAAQDRELYMEIADKYKYRGGSEEAAVWFQRVIEAGDPADSLSGESRLALADDLRRSKDYDGAIEAFDKIAKEFTTVPAGEEAEVWKAIVYRIKGDTTAAVQLFEKYVEDHPDSKENVEYCQSQIKKLTAPPEVEGSGQ